jgi:Ni/Co efflux regulator RcnB
MKLPNGNKRVATILLSAALTAGAAFTAAAQQRDNDRNRDRDHQQSQQRAEYHFQPEHRDQFRKHYQTQLRDVERHPDRRHSIRAGEELPKDYRARLKPVPQSYYRNVPPPPPGYRFGYYDGYVVAYNPTTRIVADVLDLLSTAAH